MADTGKTGPLVAVEQAILSGITVSGGRSRDPSPRAAGASRTGVHLLRRAPTSRSRWRPTNAPSRRRLRWEAGTFAAAATNSTSRRASGSPEDGTLATDYALVPLPRTGTVYTEVTVHVPVPGLRTPYSLVIVELDGVGVRALVKVTGVRARHRRHRGSRADWRCAGSRCAPGARLRLCVRPG